jgi:hypothetical protein
MAAVVQLQPAYAAIDPVRLSFLDWLVTEDIERQNWYAAYRDFYAGDHQTQLTARMRRYLQIKQGEEFNVNYCPIVVDALAERLTVVGFEAGENEEQSQALWDWWQVNQMDQQQGQVHLAAIRDGDAYVLVDWDNEESHPRFTFEMACCDSEGVKIHYSPEQRNVVEFASKRWRVSQGQDAGKMRRMNLYYPDRIEKYISHGDADQGQWQRYVPEGENIWPTPWRMKGGEPIGVPVVHFKNRDEGYSYGQSELKSVVPLQNALNKSVIDLLAAADLTGFRIYTMTGDDPGDLEVVPGTWVYGENPDTAIGVIEGADLDGLIRLKDSFAMEIARVSRTPLSYFQISAQRAAEGTLMQEEAPLVSKAKDRMVGYGASWSRVMGMGRRIANAFGGVGINEEEDIDTRWDDPETRNDKAHLETLKMKAELGVPWERLMIELDYDQDTIAQMQAQRGEELAATSNIGGELLRAFEGGR